MRKRKVVAIAINCFALLAVFAIASLTMANQAIAQNAMTTHPNAAPANVAPTKMAPIKQYFMAPTKMAPTKMAPTKMAPIEQYFMADQAAEIALARTAAPESISSEADVMVLGRHGFETAVKGKNGFVCIVERSWTSTADADFWNPQVRTPICYNAAAARSYLPRNLKRTNMILEGRSQAQVDEAIIAAVARKELPEIEPGAMCYMMSKQGYGGDTVAHWPSHLMFFYSKLDPAAWGAGLPGSPIFAMSDSHEHLTMFAIGVARWSDASPANNEQEIKTIQ